MTTTYKQKIYLPREVLLLSALYLIDFKKTDTTAVDFIKEDPLIGHWVKVKYLNLYAQISRQENFELFLSQHFQRSVSYFSENEKETFLIHLAKIASKKNLDNKIVSRLLRVAKAADYSYADVERILRNSVSQKKTDQKSELNFGIGCLLVLAYPDILDQKPLHFFENLNPYELKNNIFKAHHFVGNQSFLEITQNLKQRLRILSSVQKSELLRGLIAIYAADYSLKEPYTPKLLNFKTQLFHFLEVNESEIKTAVVEVLADKEAKAKYSYQYSALLRVIDKETFYCEIKELKFNAPFYDWANAALFTAIQSFKKEGNVVHAERKLERS
tara:strand:+ start:107 stop:1093 length:987 start_codon:yes stop_codon:yes gene_type:complete